MLSSKPFPIFVVGIWCKTFTCAELVGRLDNNFFSLNCRTYFQRDTSANVAFFLPISALCFLKDWYYYSHFWPFSTLFNHVQYSFFGLKVHPQYIISCNGAKVPVRHNILKVIWPFDVWLSDIFQLIVKWKTK